MQSDIKSVHYFQRWYMRVLWVAMVAFLSTPIFLMILLSGLPKSVIPILMAIVGIAVLLEAWAVLTRRIELTQDGVKSTTWIPFYVRKVSWDQIDRIDFLKTLYQYKLVGSGITFPNSIGGFDKLMDTFRQCDIQILGPTQELPNPATYGSLNQNENSSLISPYNKVFWTMSKLTKASTFAVSTFYFLTAAILMTAPFLINTKAMISWIFIVCGSVLALIGIFVLHCTLGLYIVMDIQGINHRFKKVLRRKTPWSDIKYVRMFSERFRTTFMLFSTKLGDYVMEVEEGVDACDPFLQEIRKRNIPILKETQPFQSTGEDQMTGQDGILTSTLYSSFSSMPPRPDVYHFDKNFNL